jgi:stress-induced morphogen
VQIAMAMDAATIEQMIREALPDARVSIEDLRGDGDHYAAHVVSASFKGKTRVQQHQMVYQALQGRMGNELHALALQTSVPD